MVVLRSCSWVLRYCCGLLFVASCMPSAPPSPTSPPAKPPEASTPAPPAPAAASPAAAALAASPAAPAAPAASPAAALAASPPVPAAPAAAASPVAAGLPAAEALTPAEQAEVEGFYRGKTVRIIVGFGAGGAYDLYARLTAKHLPKHLPGGPTAIVENQVGAGSLTAANNLFNTAPKDGTVLGTFASAGVLQVAVGAAGAARFDPAQVPWLGAPAVITDQCMVKSETGIDSIEKLLASQKDVHFGASALGNNTAILPTVMSKYLNDKIKIVTGFDGIAAIKLGVERGELDAACGSWEGLRSAYADWLQRSPPFARVVVKARPDPEGQLKDVPTLDTYLKTDEARQILALGEAPQAAGFVYATASGVPELRLKALRNALAKTWSDPEFKAEADKANLAVAPQDAQTVKRLLDQIVASPPDLLKRTRDVLGIQ